MTRAAALAASVYLVIAYAEERSLFFWVGLVLVALGGVTFALALRARLRYLAAHRVAEPDRMDP